MNSPNYNTSERVIQASKKSRVVALRSELVEITGCTMLAIVLNQLIYESKHQPGGWLYMPAAEMCEKSLVTRSAKTMRDFFKQLQALGYIDIRKNQLDPRDQTHEIRVNLEAIEQAAIEAGYLPEQMVFPNVQNVSCNKKKKTLKPLSLGSVIKKNDNTMRARNISHHEVDTDRKIRAEYHRMLRDKNAPIVSPDELDAFIQRETQRVSQAIFTRGPETMTTGERALVQAVVDGDLPLSYAVPLAKTADLYDVQANHVLFNAVSKFKQLPAWKLKTIVHPIRYLASMIHSEITDFFLDRLRINPLYAT